MSRPIRLTGLVEVLLIALALIAVATLALAQPPGGPPGGPPPGPGPGFRFGGPGGRGLSPVHAPLSALEAGLKLTATQKDKIAQIQAQFQKLRRDLMPPPPDQGGPPPDPETMRANFQKMFRLERQASQQIATVLTSEQKSALPAVLKDIGTLRAAGIPAALMSDLKLTADQKHQIASLVAKAQQTLREKMDEARQSGNFEALREIVMQSRQETHEKAMAVLTEGQQTLVENYLQAHPQPGPGEGFGLPPPGGFGPPPGGPGETPPPPPPDISLAAL
ncbi:MAG TPA: hypothetical protein VFB38_03305 [Chthonomonadaceae bacterium]|nr:hypothetical protein [Chthonomonadaceae bacterium]